MKIYQNIKQKGKALLVGGLMIPPLLFGQIANAKENLEQKILKINFNYLVENYRNKINFSTSTTSYNSTISVWTIGELIHNETNLNINSSQQTQVEESFQKIENKETNSYDEFLQNNKNFSKDQHILVAAIFGNRFQRFHYDHNLPAEYEVASQNIFFNLLQNSIITDNQNLLGVCRHIASHQEQYLNDFNIPAAAVTGASRDNFGHVYVISKTKNSTTFIDYGNILRVSTKNIEKALGAKQLYEGSTAFYHLFFQDNEFKYKLVTTDGRKFLDFVGYDETTNSLKNTSSIDNSIIQISLDYGDYSKAIEIGSNFMGFFFKGGEIKGDQSSPLKKADLYQIGFKKNFLIPNKNYIFSPLRDVKIDVSISSITGKLYQSSGEKETTAKINGYLGHFIFDTNNQKGLDWKFKVGGISTQGERKEHNIFSEYSLESKLAYGIKEKNAKATPYVLAQYKNIPEDLGTWKSKPTLNEYGGGIRFDINLPKDIIFSIDPYYAKRIWEKEFGINIGVNNKEFMAKVKGYFTRSNFEFCPDKYEIEFQTNMKASKNIEIQGSLKSETTNYDGEIESQNKMGIKISSQF